MQVQLGAAVGDDEPDRAQVEGFAVAERFESRQDVGFLLEAVQQVEVAVFAGLAAQEGVDAPAAGEPDFGRRQGFEHPQDRAGVHHLPARRSVITLATRRCRVSSVFAWPIGSTNRCFAL